MHRAFLRDRLKSHHPPPPPVKYISNGAKKTKACFVCQYIANIEPGCYRPSSDHDITVGGITPPPVTCVLQYLFTRIACVSSRERMPLKSDECFVDLYFHINFLEQPFSYNFLLRSNRLQLLEPFDAWDGNDLVDLPILIKVKIIILLTCLLKQCKLTIHVSLCIFY